MYILQQPSAFAGRDPSASITGNKLLASLPLDDRRRVHAHLVPVPMKLRQILCAQGDPIHDAYFPTGGAYALMKNMRDGGTAEVASIGNEGVIGWNVYFGDDRSSSDTLVQFAGGDAFRMPAAAFVAEMDRREAFYCRIVRYSQALLSQVMQTTVCNGLHSAEQRCCRWLLMMRDRIGTDELKVTQELLSVMLGLRRPTITLIVGELKRAGLVENPRGMINIVDGDGLERASCECYAAVKSNFARLLPDMASETVG